MLFLDREVQLNRLNHNMVSRRTAYVILLRDDCAGRESNREVRE
jgi:hypothetical protein